MSYSSAASSLSQVGVHCILQLFITSKTFTVQKLFQLMEKMEIARSKVRTKGWMIKKRSELRGGNARAVFCLNAVNTWLNELAAEEYNMGILKLVNKYHKCLNIGGDYVEKRRKLPVCNRNVFILYN
ncbi:hypothetical protein AVEN_124783-1 [Araneus ventricosus]|uniref:Uncharacterized protein n=1 Tax=Araneus ventricosus TaxID=182803 RepID=A0A4Y2I4J0_ARAVE|nr:hypothetical protein AVEN_124783-1 [Araneus ventricosus]